MRDFEVKITGSMTELSPRERVSFKSLDVADPLDSLTENGQTVTVNIGNIVTMSVHNEKAKENKDYNVYVLVDKDSGKRYRSGSVSLYNAIKDIMDEMEGIDEDIIIEIYKRESKNYKGKGFLTCYLV